MIHSLTSTQGFGSLMNRIVMDERGAV